MSERHTHLGMSQKGQEYQTDGRRKRQQTCHELEQSEWVPLSSSVKIIFRGSRG